MSDNSGEAKPQGPPPPSTTEATEKIVLPAASTAPPGPPGATGPLEPTVKAEPSPPAATEGVLTAPIAAGESSGATESSVSIAESSGASAPTQSEARPKLVRRVVVSYKMGWLPGDWLQTWRRLDRVLARANLKVKATLAPLEDLPEDTDILVVPPDLREAARESASPGIPILVTPAAAAAGAFAELVTRLEAGAEFTAEKVDPADKDKPKIVSYRGHTLLD